MDDDMEDVIKDTTETIVEIITENVPGQSKRLQMFVEKMEEVRPGISSFLKISASVVRYV